MKGGEKSKTRCLGISASPAGRKTNLSFGYCKDVFSEITLPFPRYHWSEGHFIMSWNDDVWSSGRKCSNEYT